jgi:hypothetical protein
LRNFFGHSVRVSDDLTLPVSQHAPSQSCQLPARSAIAHDVGFDFSNPIARIVHCFEASFPLGPFSPMPKIAVHEYRDPSLYKDDVGFADQIRTVQPMPKASSHQRFPQ